MEILNRGGQLEDVKAPVAGKRGVKIYVIGDPVSRTVEQAETVHRWWAGGLVEPVAELVTGLTQVNS